MLKTKKDARDSLVELLRGEGYDVHEAANGEVQGSAKIDRLDLDVVLTDLMMPGADRFGRAQACTARSRRRQW